MKLDLFLLIGQSNMAGREALDGIREPDPRIVSLNAKREWAPAIEPIHFDKPGIAGVGPGLEFARTLMERGASNAIGLIPCAVGGTKIEHWVRGGDLYEHAMERADFAMQSGQLKGILWHQGENDAMDADDAVPYRKRFEAMIRDMRERLGHPRVPFLAGKLGYFLSPDTFPFAPLLRSIVEETRQTAHEYGWIDSAGLEHSGDSLHFLSASARELGRRYAETYLSMTGHSAG
ncbi:sialate O-acetylesterase [Paenibacillus oceani]|uniref:Sialate O-acetylesterase n=1 Tax=Paenibacillus oceani TaxID=2772510 RepID=A0A927GY25_9BACL|nr:sialate O-acetylesterase [Paenibacillus oceani]MBD2860748.1 sialate O-acetylesterase [Paenibacillus oceani]